MLLFYTSPEVYTIIGMVSDDFLSTVADAVHPAHPFQLIFGFQGFGHALGFLHLPDGQCKLLDRKSVV